MHLYSYLDIAKLERHIKDGLVTVNHHKTLPLRQFTYTRATILENKWDDVTTKCRGLIVGPNQKIIARPFEKFFNFQTSYRPETHLANMPKTLPIVTEKIDGSLGILYHFPETFYWKIENGKEPTKIGDNYTGIATKGSFHSDHAVWATLHYLSQYKYAKWPVGYTPLFEIINEQIQHHIIHYGCPGKLVLIGLVNNETGEEADYNTCYFWAKRNGMELVDIYGKTVEEVCTEDRINHEGYVLTWTRTGESPLKLKVKHENFLAMQAIVHNATPKAILAALEDERYEQIKEWTTTVTGPVTNWIQGWVTRLTEAFNTTYAKAYHLYLDTGYVARTRKEFAEIVIGKAPELANICFALLDRKKYKTAVWKVVKEQFKNQLAQPFTTSTEVDEELE